MPSRSMSPWIPLVTYLILFLIFTLLYLSTINIYVNYVSNELYSYLYVSPISFIIYIVLGLAGRRLTINNYSIIAGSLYIALSLIFIVVAFEYGYIDLFLPLSYLILVYGFFILLFGGENLRFLIPSTILLATMIPIPPTSIFDITARLTRITGYYAISLARIMGTSLEYTSYHGYQVVIVNTPSRQVMFSLAPVCSGIIGLTSVLAVTSIIVLIGLRTSFKRLGFKLLLIALGLIILTLLMFLANVVRLALVFTLTHYLGYEIGYGLFHYTPEIVFIPPIAYITIKFMDKIGRGYTIDFSFPRIAYSRGLYVLSVAILFMILIPLSLALYHLDYSIPRYVFVNTHEGPPMILNRSSLTEFPVLSGNHVSYVGREPSWEQLLGPTTRVHHYRVEFTGLPDITVFVEFSKVSSQIHAWEICLKWQGIENFTARSIYIGLPELGYVRNLILINFTHEDMEGVIIYWRDKVYTEDGIEYYRVSVIVAGRDIFKHYREVYDAIYGIARSIWIRSVYGSYSVYGLSVVRKVELSYIALTYIGISITLAVIEVGMYLVMRKKH